MGDESVLICHRVSDGYPPAQSFVDVCATCAVAVWHAFSSPKADRIICVQCVGPELERVRGSGEPIEFAPPTTEQIREVRSYFEDDHD